VAKKWTRFVHADKAFEYAGPALRKAWSRLHKGDREAYPKDAAVADAWRHFHAGRFEQAVEAGRAAGGPGTNAAVKAQCVYASCLERDAKTRLALLDEAAQLADARRHAAKRDANAHYVYAFALGRYGQAISVAKALAQGLGGKIRDALTTALELEPAHAEAAVAFEAYQAEVIHKVGAMIGGLTYGAKKDAALAHFEQALTLFPESPIIHIEYGNGLILLFGKERLDDATKQYEIAAAAAPQDAMEWLDVERAKEELS
jgi:tetratricopeptide (TPR) repeat protein